jgi:NAD+ diphosphatase
MSSLIVKVRSIMDRSKNTLIFRRSEILVAQGTNNAVTRRPDQLDPEAVADSLTWQPDLSQSIISIAMNPEARAPEGTEWRQVRTLLASTPESITPYIIRSLALLNWRSTSRFCGRCGAQTADKDGEVARICKRCGLVIYPRLSPAVLALIIKDNRILLARNAAFAAGIFSLIAGFLEPGEDFEACVKREVKEELGIEVDNVVYQGSQPWPFPDSIMIGFKATWRSGEIKPDGVEIIDAGWFGPEGHPPLPFRGSLSRTLIDDEFKRISEETRTMRTDPRV